VRDFTERSIEEEKLDRILETGRRAQSAANRQPWHFIVLRKGEREGLDELLHGDGFRRASVLIVTCADPEEAWIRNYDGKNYADVDAAIALTEMIAAATAEDLGTCWVASVDPVKAKQILGISDRMELVGILVLGYPFEPLRYEEKDRKEMSQVVHWGRW